jgi:hypothetical protein
VPLATSRAHDLTYCPPQRPPLVAVAGDQARIHFLEYFTANIRNRNTRRNYAQAVREFLTW